MKLELATFLSKALEKIPGDVDLVFMNNVVRDGARKNDKRPAYLSTWVPDEWSLNIFGKPDFRDMYLAVRIPIEFVQDIREQWTKENSKTEGETEPPAPSLADQTVDPN